MRNLKVLLYITIFSAFTSLIVDIKEDFTLNIEYRLEKQETEWFKRGKLTFKKNDPSTYKSTASLIDFNFSHQMKKEIQKECKLKGKYILQFTNDKNITERYYTFINPCDLVSSNYHDKLVLNTNTPIEKGKIKSLNYMADEDFEDEYDDEEDDEEVVKKKKGKKGFTKIEIAQIRRLEGPMFAEEDDGIDQMVKKKKEDQQKKPPQSFFGRYWYIIAIVMFILMMNGQEQPPQTGQGQGQGQGQDQGQEQGGAK